MNTDRFKFRAWNSKEKRMYPIDEFTCNWNRDFKTKTSELVIKSSNILMQCTGLKDIEGTLIYEGDILRWSSYEGFENGEIKGIYVVTWNEEGYYELHDPHSDEYWPINDTEFDSVLGNIYESSHLLPDYEIST